MIDRITQIAKMCAAIAGAILLCALAYIAAAEIPYARNDAKAVHDTLIHFDGAVGEARLTAKAMAASANTSKDSAQNIKNLTNEIQADWPQLFKQLSDTMTTTRATVAQIGTISDHANALLDTTNQSVRDLQPIEARLSTAIQDTDATVNDPKIKQAIDNLAEMSKQSAGAAQQLNGTVTDVHSVTTYYRKKIEAPVTKAKEVGDFLKDLAAAALAKFF